MSLVGTKGTDSHLLASGLRTEFSNTEVDIVDSTVKQPIARNLSIVFTRYREPLPTTLVNNIVNGWLSLIKEEIYSNPSVEDIFVSIEDSDVDVWVVIPERDLAVLHQLASIEWKMLKIFVSGAHPPFLIDFHVIYRCGRNADDLVPTRTIRLPRQVE